MGNFISQIMMQLEDEYDKQTADIAHKLWLKDNKQTVRMAEVLKEFGSL